MTVKPIPDGYHTVTPYLILNDAAAALDWYAKAFGAEEVLRMGGPGGKVMHAEMQIGTSRVMLADEFPQMGVRSAVAFGGSPVHMLLYVPNADRAFERAVAAGGKVTRPLVDQFYGDRSGTLLDPFGHQWTIATHVEDVSPEEMGRRMAEMGKAHGGSCGSGKS